MKHNLSTTAIVLDASKSVSPARSSSDVLIIAFLQQLPQM